MCLWKYTRKGDFHAVAPKRTEAGCRKTLPSRKSYILNSFAVFSRCSVPAWILSNLIADLGRWTRATLGQRPPRMTALMRFGLSLFVFKDGELAFAFSGINPRSLREYRKSSRRVVISRRVMWDIKFCGVLKSGGVQ